MITTFLFTPIYDSDHLRNRKGHSDSTHISLAALISGERFSRSISPSKELSASVSISIGRQLTVNQSVSLQFIRSRSWPAITTRTFEDMRHKDPRIRPFGCTEQRMASHSDNPNMNGYPSVANTHALYDDVQLRSRLRSFTMEA